MAKTISSTFRHDADDWTMQGDVASSGWQKHGGDGGGFFHWVDAATGSDSYYVAPEAYGGDKHQFYGGTLSYDILDSGNDYSGVPDVEIVGANGVTLVAAVGQPGTDWTHFGIELATHAGWHVDTLDGATATKADFKGVLADISQLLIRAEYVSGDESGGLDNVVLSRTAPPAAAHAFGGGTGLLPGHDTMTASSLDHLDHAHHAIV